MSVSMGFEFQPQQQRRLGRSQRSHSAYDGLRPSRKISLNSLSSGSGSSPQGRVVLGYLNNCPNIPNTNSRKFSSAPKCSHQSRQRRSSSASTTSSSSSSSYVGSGSTTSVSTAFSYSEESSDASTTPRCRDNRRFSFPYLNSAWENNTGLSSDSLQVHLLSPTERERDISKAKKHHKRSAFDSVYENRELASISPSPPFGVIFSMNDRVLQESERIMLLGTTLENLDIVTLIQPGTPIFIYNTCSKQLHGGYEAASQGRKFITSNAFCSDSEGKSDSTSPFPAQVRIRKIYACAPLEFNDFASILNVNTMELPREKLMILKSLFGIPNSVASPVNTEIGGAEFNSSLEYSSSLESSLSDGSSTCTSWNSIVKPKAASNSCEKPAEDSFSITSETRENSLTPSSYADISSVDSLQEELDTDEPVKKVNRSVLSDAIFSFVEHVDASMGGQGTNSATYSGTDAFILCANVQSLIRTMWPTACVEMYGSLSTGLWLPGQSDLDILVNFQQYHVPAHSVLHYAPPPSPPSLGMLSGFTSPVSPVAQEIDYPNQDFCNESFPSERSYQDELEYTDNESTCASVDASSSSPSISPIQTVEELVRLNCYHQSYARLTNQLLLQGGDLELAEFKREDMLKLLAQLQVALSAQPWCENEKLISSAMPVVKLNAVIPKKNNNGNRMSSTIPMDISILNCEHMGLQARDYISQVVAELPNVFRPLVLILKQILREFSLHDVYKGGLGSYSLSLLVIFFLQRCGFLLTSSNALVSACSRHCSEEELESNLPRAKQVPMFHLPPLPTNQKSCQNQNGKQSIVMPPTKLSAESKVSITQRPASVILRKRQRPVYDNLTGRYYTMDDEHGNGDIPETLLIAEERIEAITSDVRANLNPASSEVDIGILLMAFLKMFSLPSDGGVDLGKIGFDLEDQGHIFLHNTPVSLCVRDPVARNHYIGSGSFAMSSVQSMFTDIRNQLSQSTDSIYKIANWSSLESIESDLKKKTDMPLETNPETATTEVIPKSLDDKESPFHEDEALETRANVLKFEPRRRAKTVPCPVSPSLFIQAEQSLKEEVKQEVTCPKAEEVEQDSNEDSSILEENDINTHEACSIIDDKQNEETDSDAKSKESMVVEQSSAPKNSWAALIAKGGSGNAKVANNSGVVCDSWVNKAKPTISKSSSLASKIAQGEKNAVARIAAAGTRSAKIKDMKQKMDKRNRSKCLFVGNMAYYATDSDVEKLKSDFAKYGKIVNIKLCLSRGSMWVTFETETIALKVLENFDQKIFLKRPLYIDFSQKSKSSSNLI